MDLSLGVSWEILMLLPEAAVLSIFPFVLYKMIQVGVRASSVIAFVVCIVIGIVVDAFYFLIWFGSGMSGGGVGTPLGELLLQTPIQVALPLIVVPILVVGLAVARVGTLGLWMFAMWAGFLSYWGARGWLLTRLDVSLSIAVVVVFGLCGLCAGLLVSRSSGLRRSILKGLGWSSAGVIFAVVGVVASGLVARPWPRPEITPSILDPMEMLKILIGVALAWLFFSTLTALVTGYVEPGRRMLKPTPGPTSDQPQ